MSSRLEVISLAPVPQERLEIIVGLRNQIRRLTTIYKEELDDVMDLLLAGCQVEPGTHVAELHHEKRGGKRITSVSVL